MGISLPDSKQVSQDLFDQNSSLVLVPNYFTGIGPYGPLGHGSFLPVVELVYHYFTQVIRKFQRERIKSLKPKLSVVQKFTEHADLFLKRTAWSGPCRSWFKQGRTDGPVAIFPGSRLVFFDILSSPRFEDYDINYHSDNPFAWLGNGFSVREYNDSDLSYYLGTKENPGGMLDLRRTGRCDVELDRPEVDGLHQSDVVEN
jgi:hypothetical protein